jgi:hypothetical protein
MSDSLEEHLSWRLVDSRHNTELWNFEYSFLRHLTDLSTDELDQRYRDLCKNISFLIRDSRDEIPIQAQVHSTWWWLRKRQQMLSEYKYRGCPLPGYTINLESSVSPPAPFIQAKPHEYKMLVRYGEAKRLVPLAERGQIRFTPASSYKNEEFGSARYDDEISHSIFIRGDGITITTMDGKNIPIIGGLKKTVQTSADMYVLCLGNEFDARLFTDFPNKLGDPADAYCVIWDTDEFSRRLFVGTERHFSRWSFHHLPMSYYDPRENGKNAISPGVSKKFEYAYQREYRFIWHPPGAAQFSQPIDIAVGPLTDLVTVFSSDGSILAGKR